MKRTIFRYALLITCCALIAMTIWDTINLLILASLSGQSMRAGVVTENYKISITALLCKNYIKTIGLLCILLVLYVKYFRRNRNQQGSGHRESSTGSQGN